MLLHVGHDERLRFDEPSPGLGEVRGDGVEPLAVDGFVLDEDVSDPRGHLQENVDVETVFLGVGLHQEEVTLGEEEEGLTELPELVEVEVPVAFGVGVEVDLKITALGDAELGDVLDQLDVVVLEPVDDQLVDDLDVGVRAARKGLCGVEDVTESDSLGAAGACGLEGCALTNECVEVLSLRGGVHDDVLLLVKGCIYSHFESISVQEKLLDRSVHLKE